MDPLIVSRSWTDEELLNLPDARGKYEVVNGELITGPVGFRHDMLVIRLAAVLEAFVRDREIGIVQGSNLGFKMANGNVRCPDISFIGSERARHYVETDSNAFFQGAPDLAVEILSPSDTVDEMRDKAAEYFYNGCRVCWIVVPEDKSVVVLSAEESERILTAGDTLQGGSVLPGFSTAVSELFRKPKFRS